MSFPYQYLAEEKLGNVCCLTKRPFLSAPCPGGVTDLCHLSGVQYQAKSITV